jgi:hypothetical protein
MILVNVVGSSLPFSPVRKPIAVPPRLHSTRPVFLSIGFKAKVCRHTASSTEYRADHHVESLLTAGNVGPESGVLRSAIWDIRSLGALLVEASTGLTRPAKKTDQVDQFSVGLSTWSMTRISTGPFVDSSFSPSCSSSAIIIDGAAPGSAGLSGSPGRRRVWIPTVASSG